MSAEQFAGAAYERRVDGLEERLKRYFGVEWLTPVQDSDAYFARFILKDLRRRGSDLDLDILETYAAIRAVSGELPRERPFSYYFPLTSGRRPRELNFQERNWSWNTFGAYLLNSPSTLSLAKQADLHYLKHVLKTARETQGRRPLRETLLKANTTWAEMELVKTPQLHAEYRSFLGQGDHAEHIGRLFKIAHRWRRNMNESDAHNDKQLQKALPAFAAGNDFFDLFLFDKYFELARKFHVTSDALDLGASKLLTASADPRRLQFTDWRVFDHALATGSLGYVTDFLFQNSHDTAMKIYLLKILAQMSRLEAGDFEEAFRAARAEVDRQIPDEEPPEEFKADLRIFKESDKFFAGDTPASGLISETSVSQVLVRWNRKLGKPQANVVEFEHLPRDKALNVGASQSVKTYLKEYLRTRVRDGTLSKEQAWKILRRELRSPLMRTVCFAFTEPESGKLLTLVRLYNGSPLRFLDPELNKLYGPHSEQTDIEHHYDLRFAERDHNSEIYEIGRLFASDEAHGRTFPLVMARVADYLANIGARGIAYMSASERLKNHHLRYGAETVLAPADVSVHGFNDSEWVMKIPVARFIHQFLSKTYRSVKPRSRPLPDTDRSSGENTSRSP